jgi:hypothetical protein
MPSRSPKSAHQRTSVVGDTRGERPIDEAAPTADEAGTPRRASLLAADGRVDAASASCGDLVVEPIGIEPTTSALQRQRSAN